MAFRGNISIGGYQPPKNKITVKELIKIILAYSAKKNNPKEIDEYSVKKPATKVASSSGRSKGSRLVSANTEIIKTTNIGRSGIANQRFF
jgi:hypothetical protein